MAESLGIKVELAAVSWQMADQSLLPKLREAPDSLVLNNGFSRRRQIREGDGRYSQHEDSVINDLVHYLGN